MAWFELILSSLGGELDQYLCEFDGQRWLVPCFSNGPWGEKSFRIGSIGYGGPVPLFDCPTPEAMVAGSLRAIRAVAQKRNQVCLAASVFPLSTWGGLEESALCGGHCVSTSIIYADQSPEETFGRAHGAKRTGVRKAVKLGLKANRLNGCDARPAQELIAQTQMNVGAAYTTPLSLVQGMLEHKSAQIKGYGVMVEQKLVSVVLALERKENAFLLFHGWDRAYANTNANELVYWEFIRSAIENGARQIDLGRSHSISLLKSKERWGAVETPILTFDNIHMDTVHAAI